MVRVMRFVESKHIEYKRELSETLEKEVVAFLNAGEGGIIYIGIDSKTQSILKKYDASVFQLSENFTRIVFPYEEGYSESRELSSQVIADEGISEGVKTVFVFIRHNPSCRVPAIAKGTGIPVKTVERHIRRLKAQGKIEFTGASKTVGYRLTVGEG